MQEKVSLSCTVTGIYEYYKIQERNSTNSTSGAVNGVCVLDVIVVCLG